MISGMSKNTSRTILAAMAGAVLGAVATNMIKVPIAYEQGRQAGIAQATSNLTSAVKDLGFLSRDFLNYRSTHMGKGYGPTNENERAGMQTGLSVGRYFADLTELTIKEEGLKLARGETTVSNELKWLIEAERTERVIKSGLPAW